LLGLDDAAGYAAPMPTALDRRFPRLGERLPRLRFTTLPTRVQHMTHLGEALGHGDLWIKRDDESAPLYGGNKPRKLEFILADAKARGRRSVLTTGGTGTHHGLATAIYARHVGLRSILVLLDQPLTEHVRHALLMHRAAGAEMYYAKGVARLAARAAAVCATEAMRGSRPYIVATGGSSAIGTIGYVDAALELAEQIAAGAVPEPKWIYVASGSGGTVAGLLLGLQLAGLRSRIAAVSVTDLLPPTPAKAAALARRCLRHLRRFDPQVPAVEVDPGRIRLIEDYVGPSYGSPTAAGAAALDLLQQSESVTLETTYTAKCLAAMVDDVRAGGLASEPVLFWNTFSSVDPVAHLGALPDYRQLPPAFHHLFAPGQADSPSA